MENLNDKVYGIIAQTLNIPVESIGPELGIGMIDQWDSMGNMAVIAALEEQLGIEFPIEDLFDLNFVEAIIEEIEKIS
ncbi:MAG: acyl carrier protein [Muribaculaceae bacterium]|nr:acyl carrier protein [Muribaculaceae bacterium]